MSYEYNSAGELLINFTQVSGTVFGNSLDVVIVQIAPNYNTQTDYRPPISERSVPPSLTQANMGVITQSPVLLSIAVAHYSRPGNPAFGYNGLQWQLLFYTLNLQANPLPAPPTLVSAVPEPGAVTVSWTPSVTSNPAVTSHTVYWTGTASGSITVSSSPSKINLAAGTYTINMSATNSNGESARSSSISGIVVPAPPPPVICFLENAPVLTPSGYRKISSLKENDFVTTSDGRNVGITRIQKMLVKAGSDVDPYIIPKGQYGAIHKLLISPNHCVKTEHGMVEARHLGLQKQKMSGVYEYYNIELPNWNTDMLVVAGVVCESLAPVRRVEISVSDFSSMLIKQYGKSALTHEVMQNVLRTCRMLPNGRVNVPVMKTNQ